MSRQFTYAHILVDFKFRFIMHHKSFIGQIQHRMQMQDILVYHLPAFIVNVIIYYICMIRKRRLAQSSKINSELYMLDTIK